MADRFQQIERLKRLGLTRNQILDRLNAQGDRREVTRAELRAIGFPPDRIDTIRRRWRQGKPGWSTADDSRGAVQAAQASNRRPGVSTPDPLDAEDPVVRRADTITANNTSAWDQLSNWLKEYGLESLAPKLKGLIQGGQTDPATLQLELQGTAEWKQRFRGNELLRQNGLGVLSPAEYLNLERSYAAVMRQFGLPQGFYDSPEDFAKFIGGQVSPQELADRAGMATDLANQVDPAQRDALRRFYGIGDGELAAYFLDEKKAMPLLQKQVTAAQIAGAGARAGVDTSGPADRFERLAERGVNEQMAQQGYAQIAQEFDPLSNLAEIWGRGDDWTVEEAEQSTFFQDADATREKRRLVNQERAAFSGASGFNARVSGRRSSAGQF